MGKFYYATAGTQKEFLGGYTVWALRSLLKAGVSSDDIHFIGRSKDDIKYIHKHVPQIDHLHRVEEDLSYVKWKYMKGKRKYALFKAAGMHKVFTKPIPDRYLIHFDGDVLWYKNPEPFFETKCDKTWYHHGKSLEKRASIKREKVDITDVKSLSKWISLPSAHLMVKYGIKKLPEREVVSGLYLLHPRDHEKLLELTYKGTKENATMFVQHEGEGEQKPMNAALSILNIDWHGGSKFFCPEHVEYFDHFFGAKERKEVFLKKVKQLNL